MWPLPASALHEGAWQIKAGQPDPGVLASSSLASAPNAMAHGLLPKLWRRGYRNGGDAFGLLAPELLDCAPLLIEQWCAMFLKEGASEFRIFC